jgi:hypothetical protein
MAETLNRIRDRLGMDALDGFLNGPRAFHDTPGSCTNPRHRQYGMFTFAQGR